MSTLDFARAAFDGGNWRVEAGYGALLAHYGRSVPVELGTPARRIRWHGRRRADRDAARRARGRGGARHRLDQRAGERPDRVRPAAAGRARSDALAAIPTGHAGKVALAFDRNVFGEEATLFLRIDRPAPRGVRLRGPAVRPRSRDRPSRRRLGGRGRGRRAGGHGRARDRSARPGLRQRRARHLRASASTAWSSDPDIMGGYSCALAGKAHLRPLLAEPLGERLFFAGEACSLHAYGTVHGAAETGIAAAEAVAERLRPGTTAAPSPGAPGLEVRRPGAPARLGRVEPARQQGQAGREVGEAAGQHDDARDLLILERAERAQGSRRGVARVERHRGEREQDAEHPAVEHGEEQRADPGAVAERGAPPGGGGAPPEHDAAAENRDVLEVVHQRIGERRLVERRRVPQPHHQAMQGGRDRQGETANRAGAGARARRSPARAAPGARPAARRASPRRRWRARAAAPRPRPAACAASCGARTRPRRRSNGVSSAPPSAATPAMNAATRQRGTPRPTPARVHSRAIPSA